MSTDPAAVRELARAMRGASIEVAARDEQGRVIGLTPFAIVPDGFKLESLEDFRTGLDRVEQRVTLLTAGAFVAYWTRFSKTDSVIFADETKGTYVAILDYHKKEGEPAWCQHVAQFTVQPSLEWKIWTGSNGKSMSQVDFARFIEDNCVDVVKPTPADMMAVASNLSAKRSVEFAEATQLGNGETQLLFNEKIRATADTKQGSIKIPDAFFLSIPVLLGDTSRASVKAMFRYRIDNMRLVLQYELHRHTQVWDAAIQASTKTIRTSLKDAPFFLGSAG